MTMLCQGLAYFRRLGNGADQEPGWAAAFSADSASRRQPAGQVSVVLRARLDMRGHCRWVVLACALGACTGVHAQSLLGTCHATSSYDVTIKADGVLFDRAKPAPRRVYLHDGQLRVDGAPVKLDAEDSDRVTLIERTVRALEPKVKAIAKRAVGLAAQAVDAQAAASAPATRAELDARVGTLAEQLKVRIAHSDSSHDWHGPAFQQYANHAAAQIVPLLAAGMLKQAVAAALSGNLGAAADLRVQAEHLAGALRTRIRDKLQFLRPRIQALCPSVRRLDQLESGIHTPLPGGVHINLVDIGKQQPGAAAARHAGR